MLHMGINDCINKQKCVYIIGILVLNFGVLKMLGQGIAAGDTVVQLVLNHNRHPAIGRYT